MLGVRQEKIPQALRFRQRLEFLLDPSGSYVFIHHLLAIEDPAAAVLQEQMRAGVGRAQFRTMDQVRDLFDGLELVEPGLVIVPDWRPEPPAVRDHPVLEMACAGVARKS